MVELDDKLLKLLSANFNFLEKKKNEKSVFIVFLFMNIFFKKIFQVEKLLNKNELYLKKL